MDLSAIISGVESGRHPLTANSPFYPGYSYRVICPSTLEISRAIGAVRSAGTLGIEDRSRYLAQAAEAFAYTQDDLEWTVRMTGMPVRLVSQLYGQIPEILRRVPDELRDRFRAAGSYLGSFAEAIRPGLEKALQPIDGFCYAITPGNDPRATAIVAANLATIGIPFIIRASIRDRAAPLVIRALIAGGFDPGACNLVYLDRDDPGARAIHQKLVNACSIVWTFGPPEVIDPTLRYTDSSSHPTSRLLGEAQSTSRLLGATGKLQEDLFLGKVVLRHAAGNCAAILWGNITEEIKDSLYPALGYPIVCTATKSIVGLSPENHASELSEYLASLVTGDPLDPAVEVGYVDPRCLDLIEELRKNNVLLAAFTGGERLSAHQARPLLVASQEDCPDFFGQEIPAYILAYRRCSNLVEAVDSINHYTGEEPRLAVSLLDDPHERITPEILSLRAHSILVGRPTSDLLPAFHEGNDYALLLTTPKFISFY